MAAKKKAPTKKKASTKKASPKKKASAKPKAKAAPKTKSAGGKPRVLKPGDKNPAPPPEKPVDQAKREADMKKALGTQAADVILEIENLEMRIARESAKEEDWKDKAKDAKEKAAGHAATRRDLTKDLLQLVRDMRTGQKRLIFEK